MGTWEKGNITDQSVFISRSSTRLIVNDIIVLAHCELPETSPLSPHLRFFCCQVKTREKALQRVGHGLLRRCHKTGRALWERDVSHIANYIFQPHVEKRKTLRKTVLRTYTHMLTHTSKKASSNDISRHKTRRVFALAYATSDVCN